MVPLSCKLNFYSFFAQATNPYLTGMPTSTYSPYFAPGHLVPTLMGPDPSSVQSPLGHSVVSQAVPVAQQKIPRSDRLEVSPLTIIFQKYIYFFFVPFILLEYYVNSSQIIICGAFNSQVLHVFKKKKNIY